MWVPNPNIFLPSKPIPFLLTCIADTHPPKSEPFSFLFIFFLHSLLPSLLVRISRPHQTHTNTSFNFIVFFSLNSSLHFFFPPPTIVLLHLRCRRRTTADDGEFGNVRRRWKCRSSLLPVGHLVLRRFPARIRRNVTAMNFGEPFLAMSIFPSLILGEIERGFWAKAFRLISTGAL